MPDQRTKSGRRDLALLSLMYDTGARVQEIADLTPVMVRLSKASTIKLIGKGNKARIVPLMEKQVDILNCYMIENKLEAPYANQYPLFSNNRKEKLTRAGIGYILDKYVTMARLEDASLIPKKFSCHCMRHSKACIYFNQELILSIFGTCLDMYLYRPRKFMREPIPARNAEQLSKPILM